MASSVKKPPLRAPIIKQSSSGKAGGYLVGKKHTEGGIKVTNKSDPGRPIEVEGGEVVITAPAVADNKTMHEFDGKKMTKREILSAINVQGGGVAFAKGGRMPKKIRCTGKQYKYGGKLMADHDIVKSCGCKHSKMVKGGTFKKALSVIALAKLHKVPAKYIREQLATGMKIEAEHSADKKVQSIIARQHLEEDKDYYKKLRAVENKEQGGELSAAYNNLVKDISAIPLKNQFTAFENHPEELLKFIQEQATGMTAERVRVSKPVAYEETVRTFGKDIVLRAVAILPQPTRKMLIKAWKGVALPKELREAVKGNLKLAQGGSVDRKQIPVIITDDISNSAAYQHYKKGGVFKKPQLLQHYPDAMNQKPLIINKEGGEISKEKLPGVKRNMVRQIELKISDRKDVPAKRFTSSFQIADYLYSIWAKNSLNIQESFYVLYLNRANELIGYQELSKGGITGTVADPELIVATASKSLAKSVVLAHNHPSGNLTPSDGDRQTTKQIQNALALISVQLLDHLILSPTEGVYYSFLDEGNLSYEHGGKLAKGGKIQNPDNTELQQFIEDISNTHDFVPDFQIKYLKGLFRSEEKEAAIEIVQRLAALIEKMPATYGTENQETDQKIVYLHYFYGGSDWYIVEKDSEPEQLQAFGYVDMGDGGEWGYISIEEIKSLNKIELDFYFEPIAFGELKKKWSGEDVQAQKPVKKSNTRFIYGEKFGVPAAYGSDLKADLQKYGFILVQEELEAIYIEKRQGKTIVISDNGGEFNVLKPTGKNYEHITSIAYDRTDGIAQPSDLAEKINEIYDDYFKESLPNSDISQSENKQQASVTTAQQANINQQIRQLVKQKGSDQGAYSAEEIALLPLYEGMGAEKKTSTDVRILDQFFTPMDIIAKMWGMCFAHGFSFPGKAILEPSVGSGRFLSFIPANAGASVRAYDVDETCATICKVLFPRYDVRHASFEQEFFKGRRHVGLAGVDMFYDLVIGNPPYREYVSEYAPLGEKKATGAFTFEMYFIDRGVDVLKPGGLLCYIIPNTFMSNDNKYNSFKEKLAQKADLVDAYRLPNGVFGNTDVGTDIILLRKKK